MDKANRSAFPGARRLAPREATDSPPLRVLEMHLDREAVRLAEREREIRASREALAALVARSTDTSDRAAEPLAAVLAPERMFLHHLSEQNEKDDFLVGSAAANLYGKSLLYLVSRALDDELASLRAFARTAARGAGGTEPER